MKLSIMQRFLCLEEHATGLAQVEREFVLYAKVDHEWLSANASGVEDHEQWEIKIPKTENNQSAGRMRVRRTQTPGNNPEYVQTAKTKLGDGSEKEVPTPSSLDAFEQFRAMSDRGMVKRRYLIDCPGRTAKWEVDVFFNEDGSPHEWVKIDYELPEGETECPPPHEAFAATVRPGDVDSADFIRNLYETVFLKCNPPAQGL